MESNMYDQPASAKFLNTYVPINFDQLYRIGKEQKETVDQAAQDLSGRVQKWSEFQSPSAKDTNRYYDLTIGAMKKDIEELAANPEALKTAEGRSRLQSKINNLDYRSLSTLKQSREGMLERQKMNQQLALSGKFDQRWHGVDFANYDSLDPRKGIFQDVSPLAYKSEVDLVKPFVDNLKAGWIKNQGGFEYSGVTAQRTDQEIMKNISSIQNTPEYAKHLEVLQHQGMTPEQAEYQLNTTLINAGREFAYEQRERDPWFMESMKLQAKAAEKAAADGSLQNLTTIIQRDAAKSILTNFSGLDGKRVRELMQGAKPTTEENRILQNNMSPAAIKERLLKEFTIETKNKRSLDAGANKVLEVLSTPISPEASDVYSRIGAGEKIGSNTYKANDSSNFILAETMAYTTLGIPRSGITNPSGMKDVPAKERMNVARDIIVRRKFEQDWNTGKYTDFIVKGENKQIYDGDRSYRLKYAYIPVEQLSEYSTQQLKSINGNVVNLKDSYFSEGSSFDEDGNLLKKNKTEKPAKSYLKIKITNPIPIEGEGATAADNVYSKKTMGLGANPQYGQVAKSQEERMN